MLNQQPPEKFLISDGEALLVHSKWNTIQGEGLFAGTPASFIRLVGCNLQCPLCFVGTTEITMGDFSKKKISEVKVGEVVLSYDEDSHEFVPKRVTRTYQRETDSIFKIEKPGSPIYATSEHPFLVKEKGWTKAKELKEGDILLHLPMSEIRRLHNPMHRKDVREKLSKTNTGKVSNLSTRGREKISEASRDRMLKNNPMKNPKIAIKSFVNRDHKLSQIEQYVVDCTEGLGVEFVGHGSLVIGNRCPDFIITGTKKLIEVWSSDQTEYMRRDKIWEENRRRFFSDAGYEVMFLPFTVPGRRENDVQVQEFIRKKISEFKINGYQVKSVSEITQKNKRAWVRLNGANSTDLLQVYNLEVEDTHTYLAHNAIVHNCDTDYTSVRKVETVTSIIEWIEDQNHKLVVLTGGEPFRQNLEKLVMSLFHDSDKLLQIETNGVFIPESFRTGDATVVCSPKTTKISKRAGEVVDAWKYVLRAGYIDLLDGLPISALGMNQSPSRPTNNSPIFVQPCDDKDPVQNRLNLKATVESCMKFGYRLCLQIHKIAEMD